MVYGFLNISMNVSTFVVNFVIEYKVNHSCLITSIGYKTWVLLVILDIIVFDVILGISWLSPYYVILVYHTEIAVIDMSLCLALSGWLILVLFPESSYPLFVLRI